MNLPSSRIPWLDNIRVFACILVIASHIVGQFFVSPPFTPDNETCAWSSFYTVLVRVSIPLFFMISGALLLPVRDTTGQFLKKRFTRVLFPFLLWSAFYTVFPWSYETLTGDSFHSVFPLSRVTPDLETMGTNLLLIPPLRHQWNPALQIFLNQAPLATAPPPVMRPHRSQPPKRRAGASRP